MLGKVLIATKALKNGWTVVIGQKNYLRQKLKYYPKGIVIEKGMRKGMNKFTKEWKKKGHMVCMSDEEAITYVDDTNYLLRNLDKNIKNSVDYFFSIGPRHYKTLNKFLPKKKIAKIGNVKYDLYKKENRNIFYLNSRNIKNNNEKFILITSRFGNVNQHLGRQIKKIKNNEYQISSKKIFNEFLELPEKIISSQSNFKKIIIRPHPSENFDTWKNKFKNNRNIKVIYKDNVADWILASSLLIQNRCTTGLEGYLLDKPVVSFGSENNKDEIGKIFNSISTKIRDLKDLKKILKKNKKKKSNKLDQILYNFKANQPDASSIIINLINKVYDENFHLLSDIEKIKKKYSKKNFLSILKNFIKKNSYNNYLLQKNGDTNLNNYKKYFDYLINKNNFNYAYRINEISEKIFMVELK